MSASIAATGIVISGSFSRSSLYVLTILCKVSQCITPPQSHSGEIANSKSTALPLAFFRAYPTEAILVRAGGTPGGGGGVVEPSKTRASSVAFVQFPSACPRYYIIFLVDALPCETLLWRHACEAS